MAVFPRYDRTSERRVERSAFAIASVVSILLFVLVLDRADITEAFRTRNEAPPVAEIMRYVALKPSTPTPQPVPVPTRSPARLSPPASTQEMPQRDSGQKRSAVEVVTSSPLAPTNRLQLPARPKSFLDAEPIPSLHPRELTAAERDSVVREMALSMEAAARRRIPTRAEKDEAAKEAGRPGTIPGRTAGEQGRAGSSGGVGVPSIFGSGPSRADRARDHTADSINLTILARLQVRARQKRDSIHTADSLAQLRPRP